MTGSAVARCPRQRSVVLHVHSRDCAARAAVRSCCTVEARQQRWWPPAAIPESCHHLPNDHRAARQGHLRHRWGLVPRPVALQLRPVPRPGERLLRRHARLQRRPPHPRRRVAAAPASRRGGPDLRGRGHLRPPGQRRRAVRSAAGGIGPAHDARLGCAPLGAERVRDGADALHPDLDPARHRRPAARRRATRLHQGGPNRSAAQGDRSRRRRRGEGAPGRIGPCGCAVAGNRGGASHRPGPRRVRLPDRGRRDLRRRGAPDGRRRQGHR